MKGAKTFRARRPEVDGYLLQMLRTRSELRPYLF